MVLFWRFCNLQCRGFAYVHRFRRRRFGKADNRDHAAIHFGNQRQRNHAGRLMREQVVFRQRCGMVVGGLDDCAFRHRDSVMRLQFGIDLTEGQIRAKVSDGALQRTRTTPTAHLSQRRERTEKEVLFPVPVNLFGDFDEAEGATPVAFFLNAP